jgi:hypothetical protein
VGVILGEIGIEFRQVADIARGGLLTCLYEVSACKSSKAHKNYWLSIGFGAWMVWAKGCDDLEKSGVHIEQNN